jgi:hypothetical protein
MNTRNTTASSLNGRVIGCGNPGCRAELEWQVGQVGMTDQKRGTQQSQ